MSSLVSFCLVWCGALSCFCLFILLLCILNLFVLSCLFLFVQFILSIFSFLFYDCFQLLFCLFTSELNFNDVLLCCFLYFVCLFLCFV